LTALASLSNNLRAPFGTIDHAEPDLNQAKFITLLPQKGVRMRWRLFACLLLVLVISGCVTHTIRLPPPPTTQPDPVVQTVPGGQVSVGIIPAAMPADSAIAVGFKATKPAAEAASTCVIYPLRAYGKDGKLATWIAETIPQVIEPKSWQGSGGTAKLCYNAPEQVLVVHQTPAGQRKVAAFLHKMKKSLKTDHTGTKTVDSEPAVVHAHHNSGGPTALPSAVAGPSYPVPASTKQPHHLFHFLIRYEGDGVIDSNVVKMARVMKDKMNGGTAPACVPQASYLAIPPTLGTPGTCPAISVGPGISTGNALPTPCGQPPSNSGLTPESIGAVGAVIGGVTGRPLAVPLPSEGPPDGSKVSPSILPAPGSPSLSVPPAPAPIPKPMANRPG
jgi:hypothetical protein